MTALTVMTIMCFINAILDDLHHTPVDGMTFMADRERQTFQISDSRELIRLAVKFGDNDFGQHTDDT